MLIMFRTTPARHLIRSTLSTPKPSAARPAVSHGFYKAHLSTAVRAQHKKGPTSLALAPHRSPTTSLVRVKSTSPVERKDLPAIYYEKLKPDPEHTSLGSSVRHTTYEEGVENQEPDVDMMAGVKQDLVRKTQWPKGNCSDIVLSSRKRSKKHLPSQRCQGRHSISAWQASYLTSQPLLLPSTWPTISITRLMPGTVSCSPDKLRRHCSMSSSQYKLVMAPL